MVIQLINDPSRFVAALRQSGLSIYDPIAIGNQELWIPTMELETLLDGSLRGLSVAGLPPKTRSRFVKEHICRALGYPVPTTFKRTQPRFPGQLFDTYVQKSNNLQVWNEELAASRRYVLIRVSDNDVITRVKVVTGDTLAKLDTTGTLTQKYQARCVPTAQLTELVTAEDTELLRAFTQPNIDLRGVTPTSQPAARELLPISVLIERLSGLIGVQFQDVGVSQERNRGAALHRLVCAALGYEAYRDDGQFPDIRQQLLEVKLQTAQTIDLGLVSPSSQEALDITQINQQQIRHCDVRYAVFYALISMNQVTLTHLVLTTGEAFFKRFPQFQGKILNRKLQIPLQASFFDS